MMEKVDCVVIGAGVIGLAVARKLAGIGRDVLILEAESRIGTGISARNSEVIHAGIYNARNTLKGSLCATGRKQLYEYCLERGIEHRCCGKLIVAGNQSQCRQLEAIAAKALDNGINDLELLSRVEAQRLEPELECCGALLSPSTGIIDSGALMLSLLGDAQRTGALLSLQSRVSGGEIVADGIVLDVCSQNSLESMQIQAGTVINCAGLGAQSFAGKLRSLPVSSIPELHYAKGNYFSLTGRAPFSRLIYPVPESAGLGIHLTFDLGGNVRFGPDVEWIDTLDYSVDARRAYAFYAEIRHYWPALPDDALAPAYAGIRPKLHAQGNTAQDFIISGPAEHGIPGLVNLYGIESPGLTSSLALADYTVGKLTFSCWALGQQYC